MLLCTTHESPGGLRLLRAAKYWYLACTMCKYVSCADVYTYPCMVHRLSAMRACKCTCSSVQRGRGWVVVNRVERVVSLSELFWMWMRPWQGKVVAITGLLYIGNSSIPYSTCEKPRTSPNHRVDLNKKTKHSLAKELYKLIQSTIEK